MLFEDIPTESELTSGSEVSMPWLPADNEENRLDSTMTFATSKSQNAQVQAHNLASFYLICDISRGMFGKSRLFKAFGKVKESEISIQFRSHALCALSHLL